ncbi:MAG: hypothetical protein FIB06_05540 [Betaproteobacteria bacterium]|nr:hypothetical protein [Betaproteobacteria bacterium]
MFWIFLLVTGLALVFVKLGAFSVMVSVLSLALQAAVAAIVLLAAVLLWKLYSQRAARVATATLAAGATLPEQQPSTERKPS